MTGHNICFVEEQLKSLLNYLKILLFSGSLNKGTNQFAGVEHLTAR